MCVRTVPSYGTVPDTQQGGDAANPKYERPVVWVSRRQAVSNLIEGFI